MARDELPVPGYGPAGSIESCPALFMSMPFTAAFSPADGHPPRVCRTGRLASPQETQ